MCWSVRHTLKEGDIGYLTYLHGMVYKQECGYDTKFEAYVASGLAKFAESFKPDRDRIWIVERNDRIIGSIAIVGRSGLNAQLRWFLVHPRYRGQGIGRKLLREAIRFSKRRRYKRVYLWTTRELDSARRLYLKACLKKTQEKRHKIWGKVVTEEKYDLIFV